MDPDATVDIILDPLIDESEKREALQALLNWVAKGGSVPIVAE